MKVSEIHDEREFYEAVNEFSSKVWRWGAHMDEDFESQPTPDELIEMLNERIDWAKEHKRAVVKYLRKRNGPTWVRVIESSRSRSEI